MVGALHLLCMSSQGCLHGRPPPPSAWPLDPRGRGSARALAGRARSPQSADLAQQRLLCAAVWAWQARLARGSVSRTACGTVADTRCPPIPVPRGGRTGRGRGRGVTQSTVAQQHKQGNRGDAQPGRWLDHPASTCLYLLRQQSPASERTPVCTQRRGRCGQGTGEHTRQQRCVR